MKKQLTIYLIAFLIVSLFVPQQIKAQSSPPQKMSYQAVIRNVNNALVVSTQVAMRISILQGTLVTPVYVETHTPTSNSNGLVGIEVGAGTVVSGYGTFSAIDWANGPFYIKIDTDPNGTAGGIIYSITGTSQLLSVPYAFYAETSGGASNSWLLNGNVNTVDNGTYFIGTTDNIPLNFKVNDINAGRIDHLKNNSFYGYLSGNANPTGGNNSAFGTKALESNTIGGNNTATGSRSLSANTTGGNNTSVGFQAMQANITGNQNTAVGSGALLVSNGNFNTATGANSLYANTTGKNNSAFGTAALQFNVSGNYNTAVGRGALVSNHLGNNNTAIGYGANINSDNLSNTTALGNGAIATASNQIRLGNANVSSLYFGTADNLAINTSDAPNMYYDFITGQIMRSTAAAASGSGNHWDILGNSATIDYVNYVGTKDNVALNFRVNDINAGRIDPDLYNTFFGIQTGNAVPTGKWNTAFGNIALRDNTTGHDNTAIGDEALTFNTTGHFNTALGEGSLFKNTTGSDNTATGYSALGVNTTGYGNTANGVKTLFSNTTGNRNAANGMSALFSNTTGYFNTANGYHALVFNRTGYQNTSNGTSSLGSNTTGNNNTADGLDALFSNTTGSDNTAVGYFALFSTIASNGNTALGDNAGNNNINNGDNNTFLGHNAFADGDNYKNATAIGFNAVVTGSDNMILGDIKVKVGIGLSGIASGPQNKLEINADTQDKSGLRFRRLTSASPTTPASSANPITGVLSVDANGDVIYVAQSSGSSTNYWNINGNTSTVDGTNYIGTKDNIPLNFRVNDINAGRIDNVLNNSFYGYLSDDAISTGANNSAFGMKALTSNSTGHMNTSFGTYSLFSNTLANGNVAVGESALYLNTTGGYNTAVGRAALLNNITGERNTAIGEGAEVSVGNLSFATAIGSRAYVEQSNSLVLGSINGINGALVDIKVGIGTTKPDEKLHIKGGFIKIEDGTQALGSVLTSDATGKAHWEAQTSSTHAIGDSYGGGTVFYVYDNGLHGLIASVADQSQSTGVHWYNGTYRYTGTTGDGLLAGKMNTALIVATQMADNQTGSFAAKLCVDLAEAVTILGDWYLPSKYELSLLYLKKSMVGGFSNANYWSSTETDSANAWLEDFTNGVQNNAAKNYATPRVRAIRSF